MAISSGMYDHETAMSIEIIYTLLMNYSASQHDQYGDVVGVGCAIVQIGTDQVMLSDPKLEGDGSRSVRADVYSASADGRIPQPDAQPYRIVSDSSGVYAGKWRICF